MGAHIIDGEFQSDKYPTCPRGKVPLSVKDKTAQDLLWEYAQRRRDVDAEFTTDLEIALRAAGYIPPCDVEWWGIYDVVQDRWWPRRFATFEEAAAHYDRCKGPGSRGEVLARPKDLASDTRIVGGK